MNVLRLIGIDKNHLINLDAIASAKFVPAHKGEFDNVKHDDRLELKTTSGDMTLWGEEARVLWDVLCSNALWGVTP